MKIVYLVGLPCSGKSTWVAKNCPEAVIISNDLVIEEIAKEQGITYNEAYKQANYKQVKKTCREKFNQAVENKAQVIVIDNTNLTVKIRKTYSAENYDRECVVFRASDETLKKRNIRPGKIIPESVFEDMKQKFVSPSEEEGFSKIIYQES